MVELPQLLKGLVEEAQLLVLVEDRDRGGELVQRIGVAAHHAFIFGADRSVSLWSIAMPDEPSLPAKSVTAKTRRSPAITVDND